MRNISTVTTTNWEAGRNARWRRDEGDSEKRKVVPPKIAPVWNMESRVTMGNDKPTETRNNVMELFNEPLGPEWEAFRQVIEQENKECWSRATYDPRYMPNKKGEKLCAHIKRIALMQFRKETRCGDSGEYCRKLLN